MIYNDNNNNKKKELKIKLPCKDCSRRGHRKSPSDDRPGACGGGLAAPPQPRRSCKTGPWGSRGDPGCQLNINVQMMGFWLDSRSEFDWADEGARIKGGLNEDDDSDEGNDKNHNTQYH